MDYVGVVNGKKRLDELWRECNRTRKEYEKAREAFERSKTSGSPYYPLAQLERDLEVADRRHRDAQHEYAQLEKKLRQEV